MPRRMAYDRWLFFTATLLVIGGLIMVGSSSNHAAMAWGMDPSAFLFKHALNVLLGFGALMLALAMPYKKLDQRSLILFGFVGCALALLLVLTMPPVNGARRWIPGPLNLQPSEFAKLFGVLFMAYMLSRKEKRVNDFLAVPAPCGLIIGSLAFLVVIEPDLGSALMLVLIPCVLMFVAGLRWRYVFGTAALGVVTLAAAVITEPYRLARIKSFLEPAASPEGVTFQLRQSLIAVGSGGLTGVGLGQGQQKALFLPAAHTDFIFSIVGEELGLIGTGILLLAFLLICWRGLRAAVKAPDRFGFYLALGLTMLIVVQGLTNMCVCLGLLPTKGLPLPLISYGGSSLLASMAATGLLLNVSQYSN